MSGTLKHSEIKKAYNRLRLIIFKNRFLIPQKPHAPIKLYQRLQRNLKDDIWAQIRQQKEISNKGLLMGQFHAIIKKKIEGNDPAYNKNLKEYTEEFDLYKKAMSEYEDTYLKPANLPLSLRPFNIFTEMYCRQNYVNKQKASSISQEISRKWKQMGAAQKNKFNQYFNMVREQKMDVFRSYIKNHQIPWLESAEIMNLKEQIRNSKTLCEYESLVQLMFEEQFQLAEIVEQKQNQYEHFFSALASQQKKYIENTQNLGQSSKEIILIDKFLNYQHFLRKWSLTHSSLMYCKKICEQYNSIHGKGLKLEKKNRKLIENLRDYPDSIEEDPQRLQSLE